MGGHSRFSASSAHRWIFCPGSVFAIEQAIEEGKIPAESSSAAANQGTCAHWVLEVCIKHGKKPKAFLNLEHVGVRVDDEMVGHIEEILEWLDELMATLPKGCKVITEKRYRNLKLLYGIDVGGTVDLTIVGPGILLILDLKYGKVFVNHIGNSQLNIYTLAALYKYAKKYKIKKVYQGIMQPRAFNEQGCNRLTPPMRPSKISRWERRTLLPAIDLIKSGNPPLIAGDHCEWCPVRGICAKQGQHLMEIAQTDFAHLVQPKHELPKADELTEDQLALVVAHDSQFRKFLDGCKKRASDLMVSGQMTHELLKVVAKNKSTSYKEEEKKIISKLKRRKVPEHVYLTEPKLVSHGILKTNLTGHWSNKKKAATFIDENTTTIDNGFTVALRSDAKKEALHVLPENEFEQFVDKKSKSSNARRRRAKR